MKQLFEVVLGSGPTLFQWSPTGQYLAVSGTSLRVQILDRHGTVHDEISLGGKEWVSQTAVTNFAWDPKGETLAVLHRSQINKFESSANTADAAMVYRPRQKECVRLDFGGQRHEFTHCVWDGGGRVLALGTGKGNVLSYDAKSTKITSVLGKHTKAIRCGAWTTDGRLVLGGDDNCVTVSSASGDTELQLEIKREARELRFAPEPDRTGSGIGINGSRVTNQTQRVNQFSVDVGGSSLLVYRLGDGDSKVGKYETEQTQAVSGLRLSGKHHPPDELTFPQKYGKLNSHVWLAHTLLLIGFDSGYLLLMSTESAEELREEKFAVKAFEAVQVNQNLVGKPGLHLSWCSETNRVAASVGAVVKLFELTRDLRLVELKELSTHFDKNVTVCGVQWSMAGRVVTVGANDGVARTFLAALPALASGTATQVAYLSSLMELSVLDLGSNLVTAVPLQAEPLFLALGETHVACGMNNQAWFYDLSVVSDETQAPRLVNQREYLGVVTAVAMGAVYAIALSEGRAFIHAVDPNDDPDETREFSLPERGEEQRQGYVTCVAATPQIAVYGTATGYVRLVSALDRVMVGELLHPDGGIANVFPNAHGTRVVCVDDENVVFLYDARDERVLDVPQHENNSSTSRGGETNQNQVVLWDAFDPDVFLVANGVTFSVYLYTPITIDGASVQCVGTHDISQTGSKPVSLINGVVYWQAPSGSIDFATLVTHDPVNSKDDFFVNGAGVTERFHCALKLGKLQPAWEVAVRAREPEMWEQLAHAAMSSLEIEFAIRVYRIVGDASMVLSLERLRNVEDVHELAANVLMLFEKPECYDMAERLFIKSNKPNEALQMRVDLKHWDAAAALARKYDAKKLDEIKREHASACETRGDVEMALTLFEESLTAADQSRGGINNAKAGVARCSFRLGDLETGLRIVGQLNDKNTYGECAFLCEQFGDANDAAALFEKAGLFENAVSIYLEAKQYDLAKPLLARIPTGSGSSSCRALRVSYANAMEFSGNFEEAANEYELARVWEHAVRIRLTLLKPCDTEKAFAICRQSRSQEAASVAAGYCRQVGDVDRAVEFLLLARKSDDAFALAGESGPSAMDKLCRLVSNDATATAREYRKLATYFETSLSWRKAGDAHAQCGNNEHAVRCYLKETSDDSVGAAIALVGSLRDDGLTSVVVEFLSSATGASLSVGDPSNKNNTSSQHTAWLFKLYVALGDYDAASTTSALLARQEQEMGNYKVAHAALFESSRELLRDGKTETRLANGVQKQLNLLHSYVLVKSFVRQQDHEGCARLLHRVAKNITKFPAHVVPILTSTVVECTRGGMKRTAVHFAQKLMAPTLRAEIGDAYKRKVETIARKPDPNAEDTTEPVSACPFCDTTGGAYDLTCNTCQADVPMCVASGRRVVAEEWAHCPSCAFPCNKAAFVKTVDAEGGECPLCRARVDASAVVAGSGGGGDKAKPWWCMRRDEMSFIQKAFLAGLSEQIRCEHFLPATAATLLAQEMHLPARIFRRWRPLFRPFNGPLKLYEHEVFKLDERCVMLIDRTNVRQANPISLLLVESWRSFLPRGTVTRLFPCFFERPRSLLSDNAPRDSTCARL